MSDREKEVGGAERIAALIRLADGLAHEIKNPLSTMSINLALLQEDWERAGAVRNPAEPEPTPREARSLKRIKTLQREVLRLEHILEEFLHYARGSQINRKPEDIARIVGELLEFVEPEDEQAGIRHHVDLQTGLPLVLADERQIKQALLNLLVNARQAMPDGGELLVRLRRVGNDVEISITDTGTGMTPEQLERCFGGVLVRQEGRYRSRSGDRAPASRRSTAETIRVVSEQGRGSSFSIYLPLAVELAGSPRTVGRGRE